MQPIFYNGFLAILPWLLGFLVIGVASSFLVFPANGFSKRRGIGIILAIVSFAGLVTVPLIALALEDGRMKDERLAEVQRVYGLSISASDFYALKYPAVQSPDNFQAYGTATITTEQEDGGLEQKRLTLVWQDGEFRLFQGEGAITTLDELPRSGR